MAHHQVGGKKSCKGWVLGIGSGSERVAGGHWGCPERAAGPEDGRHRFRAFGPQAGMEAEGLDRLVWFPAPTGLGVPQGDLPGTAERSLRPADTKSPCGAIYRPSTWDSRSGCFISRHRGFFSFAPFLRMGGGWDPMGWRRCLDRPTRKRTRLDPLSCLPVPTGFSCPVPPSSISFETLGQMHHRVLVLFTNVI